MAEENQGFLARLRERLTSPSARWSVLSLLILGLVIGAGSVIGTQVMVTSTGTNEFCGTACHSMQWVYTEYKGSGHYVNRTGVQANCHDCHIPHSYPQHLWHKAKAGIKDAIGELRGVISTEEKFKERRLDLAKIVWAGFRETDSANCRICHAMSPEILAKQKPFAQKLHANRAAEKQTCIDCHKGVAHTAPDE